MPRYSVQFSCRAVLSRCVANAHAFVDSVAHAEPEMIPLQQSPASCVTVLHFLSKCNAFVENIVFRDFANIRNFE